MYYLTIFLLNSHLNSVKYLSITQTNFVLLRTYRIDHCEHRMKSLYSCNQIENLLCLLFPFNANYAKIHTMASRPTERIEQIKTGFRIRPRYIILFFILTIFVLGGVYLSQRTKLSSIAEEKVKLQTKLDTKKVEQERLERMLEYMQTTDYKIQYAREKLGYVFADDWKFYDDSQNAKVTPKLAGTPTPLPALTTPTAKPSPTPAPMPTTAPNVTVVTMGP